MQRALYCIFILLFGLPGYAQDVTGTYSSGFDELRFIEKAGLVFGDYADVGVIVGQREGSEVTATFINNTHARRLGQVTFTISNDARTLSGVWGWMNEAQSGSWPAR